MSVCKTWIDGRGTASDVPKKKEDFFGGDIEAGDDVADIWISDNLRSDTSSR
jgi:hypothetical protein